MQELSHFMSHFCRPEELINLYKENSTLENNEDSTTDSRVVERNIHKYRQNSWI
jgi:hypothetical protein